MGGAFKLPAAITKLVPAPTGGSDVLVLRYLAPEGVPVTAILPIAATRCWTLTARVWVG